MAVLTVVMIAATTTGPADAAPRYAIHGLGVGPNSYAWAVNSRGVVVGSTQTAGTSRAFVWHRRTGARLLPSVTGDWTAAMGINDRGDIVGVSQPDAVLWRNDGRIFRIPAGVINQEPCESVLYGAGYINNDRVVVGSGAGDCDPSSSLYTWDALRTSPCHTAGCPNFTNIGFDLSAGGLTDDGVIVGGTGSYADPMAQPFTYANGTFTYLPLLDDIPGVSIGQAQSVTRDGSRIVGYTTKLIQAPYDTANRAVEWSGSSHSIRNLTPRLRQPWDDSAADSVNEAGAILLHFYDYGSSTATYRLRTPAGRLYPIDALVPRPGRWTSIQPVAINDHGVIIGEAMRNGTPRAVILTPIRSAAGTVPPARRAGPALQRSIAPLGCPSSFARHTPVSPHQALMFAATTGCR